MANQTQQPLQDPALKGLKDSLDILCDTSKRYDAVEKTITDCIRVLCEKIIHDNGIKISVKIDPDDVLHIVLIDKDDNTSELFYSDEKFACIPMEYIINISKTLHYNNPRVSAQHTNLNLLFSCQELSVALGGDSEKCGSEDEE